MSSVPGQGSEYTPERLRIIELLRRRGLTHREIAERVYLSKRLVGMVLRGQRWPQRSAES